MSVSLGNVLKGLFRGQCIALSIRTYVIFSRSAVVLLVIKSSRDCKVSISTHTPSPHLNIRDTCLSYSDVRIIKLKKLNRIYFRKNVYVMIMVTMSYCGYSQNKFSGRNEIRRKKGAICGVFMTAN